MKHYNNRLALVCGLTHPQAGRGRHAIYTVNRASGEGNATPAYRCRHNNAYLIAPPLPRANSRLQVSSPCHPESASGASRDQRKAISSIHRWCSKGWQPMRQAP